MIYIVGTRGSEIHRKIYLHALCLGEMTENEKNKDRALTGGHLHFAKEGNMPTRIKIIKADITTQKVDAIVNAANSSLLGGGGVDGAIHRVAGSGLLAECRTLNGCPTGEAKISKGYNLPVKYVIHTVGPVWKDGNRGEAEQLASSYRNCLQLAAENKLVTIAFPAISCGVYRYPITKAVEIALREVKSWLAENEFPKEVIFVCFNDDIFAEYERQMYEKKVKNQRS